MVRGLTLLTLLYAGFVEAHHSRSTFTLDVLVCIDGAVAEVGWTNPHYYLVVSERNAGTRWTFEGHSIPGLLINVTREDDETYYSFKLKVRTQKKVTPSSGFSGTWRLVRSLEANLISGSGPPGDWSLTDAAKAQVEAFDPGEDPSLDCRPRGLPRMLDWPYAQRWPRTARGINVTIEHAVETRQLGAELAEAGEVMGPGRSQIVTDNIQELVIRVPDLPPSTGVCSRVWIPVMTRNCWKNTHWKIAV